MENYFNEMLEYQEGIRASFKQGYKSDWPVTNEPESDETPAEEPAAQSVDPVSEPEEPVEPANPTEEE